MRKDSSDTSIFISRTLANQAKEIAAQHGRTLAGSINAWGEAFCDALDRGERMGLQLPDTKRQPRADQQDVRVDKALRQRLKVHAARLNTTIKDLLEAAVRDGIAAELRLSKRPSPKVEEAARRAVEMAGGPVAPKTPVSAMRNAPVIEHKGPRRAIAVRGSLIDALKPLAAERSTTVVGITEALLEVVLRTPEVLDAVDLPAR